MLETAGVGALTPGKVGLAPGGVDEQPEDLGRVSEAADPSFHRRSLKPLGTSAVHSLRQIQEKD